MRHQGRLMAGLAVVAAAVLLHGAAAAQAPLRFTMVTTKHRGPQWSTAVAYPRFDGGSPLAALANRTIATREVADAVLFGQMAADHLKTLGPPPFPYYHDAGATVSLADPALISVYFDTEEYSGGAHPNQTYVAYTFGIVGGRPAVVTLQDLFRPGDDGPKTASGLLIARLRNNPDASFVRDGTVKSIDFTNNTGGFHVGATVFVVTPHAIAFLLAPYAVASYADGSFLVKIPFDEFGGRLNTQGPLRPVLP